MCLRSFPDQPRLVQPKAQAWILVLVETPLNQRFRWVDPKIGLSRKFDEQTILKSISTHVFACVWVLPWGDLRLLASAVLFGWYCHIILSNLYLQSKFERCTDPMAFPWKFCRVVGQPIGLRAMCFVILSPLFAKLFQAPSLVDWALRKNQRHTFFSNLNAFRFILKSGDCASWLAQQFEERLDTFGCTVNYLGTVHTRAAV